MLLSRWSPVSATGGFLRRRGQLTRVFSALVGSQFGGAAIGLLFWAIAARALSPDELGLGAGLVAAATLLAMFGVLGIGTWLMDRLKFVNVSDRRALVTTGLLVAGTGGVLAAALWLVLSVVADFSGVLGSIGAVSGMLLAATTAVASVCLAFDQAVLGLGASSLQVRRNILASVIRIAVFGGAVLLDVQTGQVLLLSWTVGLTGSLLLTRLRPRHLGVRGAVPVNARWRIVRTEWAVALGHHGLTLAMVSSTLLLNVVVGVTMSASDTAYFSQARLLAETVLAIPSFLCIALFATTRTIEDFALKAPRTLGAGMALAILSVGGAALLGPLLLSTFGAEYATASQPILLMLLTAGPLLLLKDHVAVVRRLEGMRMRGAVEMAIWTAAELTGAVIGAVIGHMPGLFVGWLGASALCAAVTVPVLVRAMRRRSDSGEPAESVRS